MLCVYYTTMQLCILQLLCGLFGKISYGITHNFLTVEKNLRANNGSRFCCIGGQLNIKLREESDLDCLLIEIVQKHETFPKEKLSLLQYHFASHNKIWRWVTGIDSKHKGGCKSVDSEISAVISREATPISHDTGDILNTHTYSRQLILPLTSKS